MMDRISHSVTHAIDHHPIVNLSPVFPRLLILEHTDTSFLIVGVSGVDLNGQPALENQFLVWSREY